MGTSSNPQVYAEIAAGPLENWLNCINATVDEYKHHVTEHGFRAQAVDPTNASMVQTPLGGNEFETFDCSSFTFGIEIDPLLNTLSKASAGDIVTLEIGDDYRLTVSYGPIQRSIATIDPDMIRTEPDIPDLDHIAEVVLETDDFDDAVWTCDMVADAALISTEPDGSITFSASGDTDSARTELGDDYLRSGSSIDGSGTSTISIGFMDKVIKALPCDTVELSIGDDLPIKIVGDIGEHSRAQYHIAPRLKKN